MNAFARSLPALLLLAAPAAGGGFRAQEPPGSQPPGMAADLSIVVERYFPPSGSKIGVSGIFVVDLDGDGVGEIIAGASPATFGRNRFWQALERGPISWQPRYAILPREGDLYSLVVDRGPALGKTRVFAGYEGLIAVHQATDGALLRELQVPGSAVSSLQIADIDADGRTDAVYCDGSAVYVVGVETGEVESVWPYPCKSLAVGELDGDAPLEVVIADGTAKAGLIVDGFSGDIEVENPAGFGRVVAVGNLDGHGLDEIVAGHQWHDLRVYESDGLTERFSIDVFNLGSLALLDIDGDGSREVLFADNQSGGMHAVDGVTGEELWEVPGGGQGPSAAALGNVGGDKAPEVVWSYGGGTTAPDFLRSTSQKGQGFEDLTVVFGAPHYGAEVGDLEGDGRDDLVLLPSAATEPGSARYFVFDPIGGTLLQRSPVIGNSSADGKDRVRLAQGDTDPQLEVLAATWRRVGLYDGVTQEQQWTTLLPSGEIGSLDIADVDGDGGLEVLVGTDHPAQLTVLDLTTGEVEWASGSFSGGFLVMRVAELDGDPNPEVVVSDTDPFGDLYVFSPDVGRLDLEVSGQLISAIDTPDLDGDGVAELFVGTWRGEIWQLDTETGAVLKEFYDFPDSIEALSFHDVGRPGGSEFAIAIHDELKILDLSGAQLASYRSYPPTAIDEFGRRDSLRWDTIQGRPVLLANLGRSGTVILRVTEQGEGK